MLKQKLCKKCHRYPILDGCPGDLCADCWAELPDNISTSLHYDVKDLKKMLGLSSEEQVRRKARGDEIPGRVRGIRRYLWFKAVIDKWLQEGQPNPKNPTTPLGEEAKAMCMKKDHSWLNDDKYDGVAFTRKSESHLGEHTIKIGWRHTCYFCGFSRYIQFG